MSALSRPLPKGLSLRHIRAYVAGSRTVPRAIAALTFSLLFLLTVFARPALAQSADNTPAKAQAPKLVLSPDKVLPFGKIIAGLTGGPLTVTATNPSTSESIAIDNVTVSAPFAIFEQQLRDVDRAEQQL